MRSQDRVFPSSSPPKLILINLDWISHQAVHLQPPMQPENLGLGSSINTSAVIEPVIIPAADHSVALGDQGITPTAPPGFPLTIFLEQQHTLKIGAMQFLSGDVLDPVL